MPPTRTLSPDDLGCLNEAEGSLQCAWQAVDELEDKMRRAGDHCRVATLRTARNRLEEAQRIVQGCFR